MKRKNVNSPSLEAGAESQVVPGIIYKINIEQHSHFL